MVNEKDMALRARLYPYTTPDRIPVSFRYGDRVVHGIPSDFHPKATVMMPDDLITITVIEGKDENGLTIRAECTEYRDAPTVEWVAFLTNEGSQNTPLLTDFKVLDGFFAGEEPVLQHGVAECRPDCFTQKKEVVDHEIDLHGSERCGLSCVEHSPYMRLWFSGTYTLRQEPDPYSVALAVGWTGNWQVKMAPGLHGVTVSVSQTRFHTVILPGETLRTPRVTLVGAAGTDPIHAMNVWRKWYLSHILPCGRDGNPVPPMLCLHVFAEGGEEFTGATEKQQVEGLQKYIDRGHKPDVWWVDAGWYPCGGHWWSGVGNWTPDPERFPHGLAPIGELCEKEDVRFLLWFEPERVFRGSKLYEEHPEWLLKRLCDGEGKEITETENNALFDLGNEEARNWLINWVDAEIKRSHIGIYRQDFNFSPAPYWNFAEAEDRIGALENRHIQGYYAYWDALVERNPGLLIDSCAGGGRRNDLETMRRAVTLHYTDIGYGDHPMKQRQHRYMFEWIPYFRAHNMSWDDENGNYGGASRPIPDRFAFHCALAPSLTDMTNRNVSDEDMALSVEMTAIWREAASLMLTGDYYPLTGVLPGESFTPEVWYAMQFEDEDAGRGFIQTIRNVKAEDESLSVSPYVSDPDPDTVYTFVNRETGDSFTKNGKQLADEGLTFSLAKRQGAVWFYTVRKTRLN